LHLQDLNPGLSLLRAIVLPTQPHQLKITYSLSVRLRKFINKSIQRSFKINFMIYITVFFSFLKRERERDFANVSDRPTSLTVHRF
jgi:hypothetical protein